MKRIRNLIDKNDYEKYIFTKFINKNNSMFYRCLNWKNLQAEYSQNICLPVPNNSVIFEKETYSLSEEQIVEIKSYLNAENMEVDICGLQTDACVYAISLQLFDSEILPNLLVNYTATENNFKFAIRMFKHQFGKINKRK